MRYGFYVKNSKWTSTKLCQQQSGSIAAAANSPKQDTKQVHSKLFNKGK
jgi:hypothetical protein